jgi:ABC-type transport system substrate-binding protein
LKKVFLWLIIISIVASLSLTLTSCPAAPPVVEETTPEETTPEEVAEVLEIPLSFSYDPDMARAILADAGYVDTDDDGFVEAPDGSKIELTVTCPFGWKLSVL